MSAGMDNAAPLSLSIALASKRLGFVVMDKDGEIVDCGVKCIPSTDAKKTLAHFNLLYEIHQPGRVCLQDRAGKYCRLGKAAQEAIKTIERQLYRNKANTIKVSKDMVWASLRVTKNTPKDMVANIIAELYPSLAHLLPPKRKIWDAEHRNMPIFVAAGLGITCL